MPLPLAQQKLTADIIPSPPLIPLAEPLHGKPRVGGVIDAAGRMNPEKSHLQQELNFSDSTETAFYGA